MQEGRVPILALATAAWLFAACTSPEALVVDSARAATARAPLDLGATSGAQATDPHRTSMTGTAQARLDAYRQWADAALADLPSFGPAQLARVEAEARARRGYTFEDEEPVWRHLFESADWYRPGPHFDPNDVELQNDLATIRGLISGTVVNEMGGREFAADLDLDGGADLVRLEVLSPDAFRLQINGLAVAGVGDNLAGCASVIDLDRRDRQREVMVTSQGPSGDPSFQLFTLGDRGIVAGERAEGRITQLVGDGTFAVEKRAHVLQTWFYDMPHRLVNGPRVESVPMPDYATSSTVVMRRDLPLSTARGSREIGVTLRAGEVVDLVATDDVAWVRARAPDGSEGWFEVWPYDVVIVSGRGVPAGEVFEGLSAAD